MGQKNNAILNYLSDKTRFADLINAEVYGGRQVIKPDGLTEVSSSTYRKQPKSDERKPAKRQERRGDIVMQYKDGTIFRIFLLEAQNKISYVLPIKSIDYLLAQYLKQLSEITAEHKRKDDFGSIDEQFSGINKNDKLKPEYIIWLYHGEKQWDGPRTLSDMMDFGDDRNGFKALFQDFEPHLLCVNEIIDTTGYKTELRELLDLLIAGSDKNNLKNMVNSDKRFSKVDEDTLETAAVLLNAPAIWKNRKNYINDDEGRDYDMCKALEDWAAEIRAESDKEIKDMEIQLGQKEAQIKQRDAQIEQDKAQIDSLLKKVEMLQAQIAGAVN